MNMFGRRDSGDSANTADSKEKLLVDREDGETDHAPSSRQQRYPYKWSLLCHGIFDVILISVIAYLVFQPKAVASCRQILYTPASESISFEVHMFNAGYLPGEKSVYQLDGPTKTPTNETDKAWSDLYKPWMWSKIPRGQAARLTNLTINIPGEEDQYLIGLDVFHQLHCLDNVRKGLWPDRYRKEDHMGGKGMSLLEPIHLDHCVDQIRQSLMCASDLSTNYLYWDEASQTNTGSRSIHHSCRNFDKVIDWAREHKAEPFDLKIHLQDPLKDELVGA